MPFQPGAQSQRPGDIRKHIKKKIIRPATKVFKVQQSRKNKLSNRLINNK